MGCVEIIVQVNKITNLICLIRIIINNQWHFLYIIIIFVCWCADLGQICARLAKFMHKLELNFILFLDLVQNNR